ncbi:MAG TPA: DNA translocase FtsK [Chloroflexota bacterium]|jgi:S-DNA-T family DNA segregation ATPase FtsK/SpoIIIE|nr:DNA translocase FtsK [Chloroflexota bacterium]
MAQAQLKAVPPRRRRPEPEPESEFKLAEPLAQEIIGIGCLILAGLCLLSIFPADSLLSRTIGPAILQALGAPGGVLLALGLAGLGAGFFWQGMSEEPRISWQRIVGFLLLLSVCCAMSQLIKGIGGLFGAGVFQGMRYIVGQIGAVLVLIGLLAIAVIMTFQISLAWLYGNVLFVAGRTRVQVEAKAQGLRDKRQDPSKPLIEINTGVDDPGSAKIIRFPKQPKPAATEKPAVIMEAPEDEEPAMASIVTKPDHDWALPPLDLLEGSTQYSATPDDLERKGQIIIDTLAAFGVDAVVKEIKSGPAITRFGLLPAEGVKVSRITSLADDIALRLSAASIRVQAPVPGYGMVGIEIPNDSTSIVNLRSILKSDDWNKAKGKLRVALGRDVAGKPIVAELNKCPHLLIAGSTGSGKSVCINTLVASLLFQATPDELKLVLIDPKMVEMTAYRGLPHLQMPVVTKVDMVLNALKWLTREMERRYELFAAEGVRNIEGHNAKAREQMPYMVVIIDELADLMMTAPDEVERIICRLAQLARATGIHLVVATQRPSVDVVTGLIKANLPARIAFAVSSQVDSRTILDGVGAEKLLGRGDALYAPSDSAKQIRLQGTFVSDKEISNLVGFWRHQVPAGVKEEVSLNDLVQAAIEEDENDELLAEAREIVMASDRASTSLLQRKLRIGYNRAARLMDLLEDDGVVGPPEGNSRAREVLVHHEVDVIEEDEE